MASLTERRSVAKAYVAGVVILGVATVAHSLHALYIHPIGLQWLVLAALTLLTGSFTIKVPSTNATLSVSETFVFASVLLFGAAAGAVTVLLECLTILFWFKPAARSVDRLLFNIAAPAIAIWTSGTAFFWMSGIEPYSRHATPLQALFIPLVAFTVLYFLLNSWLVAIALGFESGASPIEIWWTNFTWLSINYFSGASVAALIVTYSRELDFSTLAIIVPLLVVSYLTFRTAMGRVEDTNQHLAELNRLYMSTIETLAMAIDAKDQVTHGHIRRVQTHAVALAKRVGVRDENLIKAIEAAALLHDMGKLAVPEYILNKPGKLTETEFERMKLHASVGADILTAIDFPYPVVPIVRHHHENWDGSGYPAGLKSTDIPIGARILAVVDCFDALTSDRPYRPRLSDNEALEILIRRRGTMYDPLIVDTFLTVHSLSTSADQVRLGPAPEALDTIAGAHQPLLTAIRSPRLDDITASADEMLTLYALAQGLAGQVSFADAADIISKHLRRLIPSSLTVFYLYDPASGEIEAKHVSGEGWSLVHGLRIPLGQRLSGWVGANQRTICNSDPSLDLGDIARSHSPRLRSCISTPMLLDQQLVGVLSLYSGELGCYNDDHRRIIELIAGQIALTLKRSADADAPDRHDALTGLPGPVQLRQFVEAAGLNPSSSSHLIMLFVDIVGLKQFNTAYGRLAGDEILRHVAKHIRNSIRLPDLIFRYISDEFVVVLNDSDANNARAAANRIREAILEDPVIFRAGHAVKVDVRVSVVRTPLDGSSLNELIAVARARAGSAPGDLTDPMVH